MEIYTGLDLRRNRLDWQALAVDVMLVDAGAVRPDPQATGRTKELRGRTSVICRAAAGSSTTSASLSQPLLRRVRSHR